MKRKQQTGACVTSRLKEEKSKYDSPLLTFEEFLDYMKIGRTTGRRLTNDPMCRYVVRIGRKVMIHNKNQAGKLPVIEGMVRRMVREVQSANAEAWKGR